MIFRDEDRVNSVLLHTMEEVESNERLMQKVNNLFLVDDRYTHSSNVAKLGTQLAIFLGLDEASVSTVCMAGLLHDIGKIYTPREILYKQGSLTDEEFEIIKRHPVDGYNILSDRGVDEEVLHIVLNHHEKWTGTGYPNAVVETELKCSIVTTADVFSALIEPRPYHQPRSLVQALDYILTIDDLNKDLVSSLAGLVVS